MISDSGSHAHSDSVSHCVTAVSVSAYTFFILIGLSSAVMQDYVVFLSLKEESKSTKFLSSEDKTKLSSELTASCSFSGVIVTNSFPS